MTELSMFVSVAGFCLTILINAIVITRKFTIVEATVERLVQQVIDLKALSEARAIALDNFRHDMNILTIRLEQRIDANEKRIAVLEMKDRRSA